MTTRTARAERWRCVRTWHGPVLLVSAALLSCGQQRVPPEPTSGVTPAVSSPSHLVAGDVAPATGTLRNPHAGDAGVARSGALGTEGVWTLVTYLRSLPAPPNVPTQSWQN